MKKFIKNCMFTLYISFLIGLNILIIVKVTEIAVPFNNQSYEEKCIYKLKKIFGINHEVAKSIYHAASYYDLNPLFLATLLKTESNFCIDAVSSKGYKGIGQTPTMTKRIPPDVFHSADILNEKFKIANNNTELAVALYKGGNNKVAREQARKMLDEYIKLKKLWEEDIKYEKSN